MFWIRFAAMCLLLVVTARSATAQDRPPSTVTHAERKVEELRSGDWDFFTSFTMGIGATLPAVAANAGKGATAALSVASFRRNAAMVELPLVVGLKGAGEGTIPLAASGVLAGEEFNLTNSALQLRVGALAGVSGFVTRCSPVEESGSLELICGLTEGDFPVTLYGPWVGPAGQLVLIPQISTNEGIGISLFVFGEFYHVGGDKARTLTVQNSDGTSATLPYHFGGRRFEVVPTVAIGAVVFF